MTRKSKKIDKNWLEWTIFAAGAILTLTIVGALAWDAWAAEPQPVECTVSLQSPERTMAGTYRVPVEVRNGGSRTAADVIVEVEMESGGETETATFELQFLPRTSTQKGAVEFRTDPARGKLQARCLGYAVPD